MRLALCGNAFPADTPAAVCAALRGPVRELTGRLREGGWTEDIGFGLYLPYRVAMDLRRDRARVDKLRSALAVSGAAVWTANAFPFGGFHDARVKERAFQPDWRDPERLQFTLAVAELLVGLAPEAGTVSVSTCPLGYGPEAVHSMESVEHLKRLQDGFRDLERQSGVKVLLAIEPEPDGGFERVDRLCAWLGEHLPDADRLGVCWDLCHSAVVGESPEDVLSALADSGVPLGKVQVSAALAATGPLDARLAAALEAFSEDPYLHQVRARDAAGEPMAYRDLPQLLAQDPLPPLEALRVHCHVPIHAEGLDRALRATDWRTPLAAAQAAGIEDFEVETYTLRVLPRALRRGGMVGTMVEEMLACAAATGLLDAQS